MKEGCPSYAATGFLFIFRFSASGRFANTVFRALGGLKYDYVTKGEKAVILWRALASVAPFLKNTRESPCGTAHF